jgi:predicted Zn-dependent peptidase
MDVTQATLNEIYHEMQMLIDEPIPAHEMELIRGNMMGSLAGAVTNAFSLSDCFKTVHFGGVDYSYFENLKETIRNVSPKEIQETAAKYLQRDLFCEIVAGGK